MHPNPPADDPAAIPLLGLLLLPRPDPAADLIQVQDSSQSISDALGGLLLDDTAVVGLDSRTAVTFYRADRTTSRAWSDLPDNPATALLAARFGLVDRHVQEALRGPVLVLGLDLATGTDTDVPDDVIEVAQRLGIRVTRSEQPPATAPDDRRG